MIFLSSLRSLIAIAVFVAFTGFWSLIAILETLFVRNRQLEGWILSSWGRVALRLFGVKLEVKGREHIPSSGCLFLFNHTSFFDIFAMLAAFEDFRFGAKIELFKIPLFGAAMRQLGMLPIARSRREEVFRVYQEAQERAQKGEKFALAPEGKRNDRESLLPFKSGPFIFAINSQVPLVPVVIRGAYSVLGRHSLLPNWDSWSRTITVQYLPPIPTQGLTLENRGSLQDHAYASMKPFFIDDRGTGF